MGTGIRSARLKACCVAGKRDQVRFRQSLQQTLGFQRCNQTVDLDPLVDDFGQNHAEWRAWVRADQCSRSLKYSVAGRCHMRGGHARPSSAPVAEAAVVRPPKPVLRQFATH